MFSGTIEEQIHYLTDAAHVPIKRHTKIRGEANPYDPEWETYYEKRLDVKMVDTYRGKQWLIYLWKEQEVSVQSATKRSPRSPDGIVITFWRSKGGPDTKDNCVLLHPTCHQQVHSQGLTVTKPPPLTKEPYGNNLRHKGEICDTRRHGAPIKRTEVQANAREPQ